MNSFFKKIINKLKGDSESSNDREEIVPARETPSVEQAEKKNTLATDLSVSAENEEANAVEVLGEKKSKDDAETMPHKNKNPSPDRVSDAVELQELTLNAILNTLRPFAFGNTTISAIKFHLKYGKTRVESIASAALFQSDDFVDNIKVKLSGLGIKYAENFKVYLVYDSTDFEQFTSVTQWLSIEPLTGGATGNKIKAIVRVTRGFLWEDDVELQPTDEPYYVGRGKNPKLPDGIFVSNKVAFISPDEIDDPKYEINRYVSRSIACIFYDENTNEFKVMRSKLMDNSRHTIKIVRIGKNNVERILLNNTINQYTLKDGDQITFNEKASIKINILEVE